MIHFSSKNPDINSSTKNKFGYIHYSGIILDTLGSDIDYLKQILTNDVNECIVNLKKIQRGQFVLIYSTNDFTIVYTDVTSSRRIFEIDQRDNETIFCDDLGLHQVVFNYDVSCAVIPTNYIVVYDKNFDVVDVAHIIDINYQLKQNVDSYEPLIAEAGDLLDNIYKKFKNINLFLSDGHDSGFVHLLSLNKNIPCDIFHRVGRYLSDVNDIASNESIINKRINLHKDKFPNSSIGLHKFSELKKLYQYKFDLFKKTVLKNNFITDYDHFEEFNTFFSISSTSTEQINLIIEMGYILSDSAYLGKVNSQFRSKFGSIFPKNLGLHHTWWLNHNQRTAPLDIYVPMVSDYLNRKQYQFYSTKSFLLEYMKLDRKLKSNQKYKPFIKYYFEKHSYPYIELKNGKRLTGNKRY